MKKRARRNPSKSDERVVNALKWVDVFRKSPSVYREQRKKEILSALLEAAGDKDTTMNKASLLALKRALEDTTEFTLVGVVYQIRYFKLRGEEEDLYPEWVHPFSVPTLMFASKKLPMIMIVNPALRYNKSFLSDIPFNKDLAEAQHLAGHTG